jgi:hypothetical protein
MDMVWNRMSHMTMRVSVSQALTTLIVAVAFVALSIWIDGYLAAIPYPKWYADLWRSHKVASLFVWTLFQRGAPDAMLAAI